MITIKFTIPRAVTSATLLPKTALLKRLPRGAILTASIALCAAQAEAASGTWLAAPTSGNWVTAPGETNWTNGLELFPGSTAVLNSPDVATFLTSATTAIVLNSPTLNVRNINFGVSAATPSAFTIGTLGGDSLFLTSGGTTQVVAGSTGTNITQTINAPIVIQPATGASSGSYNFANNHASSTNRLVIAGGISGGLTSLGTNITLSGANTGTNTVSGVISNGLSAGGVSVTAFGGVPNWGLTAANTYTGATSAVGNTALILRGATGSALNTGIINLGNSGGGGTIRLDNTTASGGPNNNRLADFAAINANGGASGIALTHSAVALTSYSETVGAVNLNDAHFTGTTSAAAAGQSSILTFSGLSRVNPLSTMQFTSGNADNIRGNVFIAGFAPSTFLGGWATVTNGSFAQYSSTRGVFAVGNTNLIGLAAGSSSATTSYNLGVTGTTTLPDAAAIYAVRSLTFNNSSTISPVLDLNGSTLKVASGGIANASDVGGSTISNGTVTVGDGNSSPLFITTPNSGTGLTMNAVIADNGGPLTLVKTGAGVTLTLAAANTFTGSTYANSGTIAVTNAAALQFSVLDYNSHGGTVTFTNANTFNPILGGINGAQSLTIGATIPTFTVGNSHATTGNSASYSGVLGNNGTFRLIKVGTNTQTLTGANNFNGGVEINGGILAIGGTETAGTTGPLGKTGAIHFGGGTLRYSATNSFDYSSRIAAGTSTSAVSVHTNGFNVTFATALTAAQSGGLTKLGGGTLTLSAAHAYTGTTTVSGGTVDLGGSTANGSLASTALVLRGGTFAYTRSGDTTQDFTAGVTINAGASAITAVAGNTLTLNGLTRNTGGTLDVGTTGTITTSSANVNGILRAVTFGETTWAVGGGTIVGLADGSYITTAVAGTSAPNYTASGNIDVTNSAGLLSGVITTNSLRFNTAAANTVTLATGANTISSGGILVTSTVGSNLSTITGGTLRAAASADLVVIQNNTSEGLTINSVLGDNSSTALTKSGAGLLTLTNSSNTYTGQTYINGGILSISSNTNLGAAATGATLNLNNGTLQATAAVTLDNSGVNNREVVLTNAAGFDVTASNTLTVSGVVSGSGDLNKTNTGTLILSGINTYTGSTSVDDGILSISASANLGAPATGAPLTLNVGTLRATASVTLDNGGVNKRGVVITNGGVFDVTDANVLTVSGVVSGIGSLTKINTGTLTLSGTNTFTGTTAVNGGILSVSSNANLGAVATGATLSLNNSTLQATASVALDNNGFNKRAVVLTDAAAFEVTNSNFLTVSGVVSGSSSVTKSGTGTLIFSGANLYTGVTTLAAGSLNLGVAEIAETSGPLGISAAANPGSIVLGGGFLQYSAANQNDYSGRFSTAGSQFYNVDTNGQNVTWATVLSSSGGNLTKTGNGTLTLPVANTYTGSTTVSRGTLVAGSVNALGSVNNDLTVNTGGVLDLAGINLTVARFDGTIGSITSSVAGPVVFTLGNNDANAGSYAGSLGNGAGTLTLSKIGAGAQTLTGVSTFSGGTSITGGQLSINSDAALGAAPAPVAISGGSVLQAIGNVTTAARTVTLGAGGGGIEVATGNVASFNAGSTITGAQILTKTGDGTLTLAGTQTYSTLTTSAGTTNVNSALGTGAATVNADATTNFGVSQTLAALNIGAGAVVTLTATPPFAPFAGGGSAVVPEPGSITLLLIGALGLAGRRRRA